MSLPLTLRRGWPLPLLAIAVARCTPFNSASGEDAGPTADAAPDGGRDAGRFACDSSHLFCEDFEHFDASRYQVEKTNATFSIATGSGFQSDAALLIETQAVGDQSNACAASLSVNVSGPRWRFVFAVRILTRGEGRYRAVDVHFPQSNYVLELWLDGNGTDKTLAVGSFFTDNCVSCYAEFSSTATLDAEWHEVVWEIDPSEKQLSLRVDVRNAMTHAFPLPQDAGPPKFTFGAARVFTPSTPWSVQIDNVRIDTY